VYSANFLEWKKRVLEQQGFEETTSIMSEDSSETSILNSDVLNRAVDEILQRNGLLK
jgi:hypothetical protein